MDIDAFLDAILYRSDDWPTEANNDSANMSNLDLNFMTRHPTLSYFYLTTMGILSIVGTLGNCVVIGSIIIYKPLRTTGNMFIANLALTDLCITTVIDPFIMIGVIRGPRYFFEHLTLCHFLASLCTVGCICSQWNVTFVAANRYIFLCKNHWYEKVYSWFTTFLYCVCIWMTGVAFELPNIIGWGQHTFDLKNMYCFYDRQIISYTYFLILIGISIPMCAICFSYYKIFMYVRTIRGELRKIGGTTSMSTSRARQRDEIQLAKTFATLCVIYVLCYTPFTIVILTDRDDNWSKIFYVLSVEISHLNNSVNSILYGLMNKRFQEGYRYLFLSIKNCFIKPKCKEKPNSVDIITLSHSVDSNKSNCYKRPKSVNDSLIGEDPDFNLDSI